MKTRLFIIAVLSWTAIFLYPEATFSNEVDDDFTVITADEALTSTALETKEALVLAPIELKVEIDRHSRLLAPSADGLTRGQRLDFQTYPNLSGLDQAIAKHSGIQTANAGSRLAQQSISMRGSASQDIRLSYGGVVLNGLSQSGSDLSILPLSLVSSLEFLPNAGSQSLGLGSLGGAILIEPLFDTAKFKSSIVWGSHGDYGLSLSHGQTLAKTRYQLTAFGDKNDGQFSYIDDEGSLLRRTHNAGYRLGGQAQVTHDFDKLSLEAFAFLAYLERDMPGASEFPDAYRLAKQANLLSLAKLKLNFESMAIGDNSYLDILMQLSHRFARNSYSNPKSFMGELPFKTKSDEHRSSFQADARLFTDDWSEASLGLYYDLESVVSVELSPTRDAETQIFRHILGISLSEQLRFFADKLQVFTGIRLDWPVNKRPLVSARLSAYGRALSWLSLHTSLGYAARLPSFDEQHLKNEFVRGNPKLSAQRSLLSDLAIHFELASYLSLELVGFCNLHWSLIRFIPVSAQLHQAQNLPPSLAAGLESRLVATPITGLELSLSYHFTDAFLIDGRLPMPQIARHRLSSQISYQNAVLRIALNLAYSGKLARSFYHQYRPHDGIELGLSLDLSLFKDLRLSLEFSNLTNDRRREDIIQHPMGGMHAMLGLSYKL